MTRIIRKLRSDAGNARQLVGFDAWRNTLKLRNPDGLQLSEPRGRIARKVANRFGDDTKAIPREAIEQQRREYHAIFGKHAGDANSGAASQAILGAYWGKEIEAAERTGSAIWA